MEIGDWVVVRSTGKQGPILRFVEARDLETGKRGPRAVVLVRCAIAETDRIDVQVAYDPADLVPVPVGKAGAP